MQKESSLAMVESWQDKYDKEPVARPAIPDYLETRYWWAYLHPKSVRFFEHQWVINTILWGNYARLSDSTLDEFGTDISGRTLQVACVYGNLTQKLGERHLPSARLDVVDVAPIQLENLWQKVKKWNNIYLDCQDASNLSFEDQTFDQVLVFFLLHELPLNVRNKAIQEVLRVVKPGGKVIFVDYHRPVWQHPHRYLMQPILRILEPFALDLWNTEIVDWVDSENQPREINKTTYFGGLYQKVVMRM
jgi:ubiquinone/menaquinone biosynthesis C-methylase UbiE